MSMATVTRWTVFTWPLVFLLWALYVYPAQAAHPRHKQLILYHQTSPENAKAILKSKQMIPGFPGSYAGSGIYFATTPEDTNHKARYPGVILSCKVDLGRTKEINKRGDWSADFWQVWYGYDSILITSLNGLEFVVYNPARVKTIRVHSRYVESPSLIVLGLKVAGEALLVLAGALVLCIYLYFTAWCTLPIPMVILHAAVLLKVASGS